MNKSRNNERIVRLHPFTPEPYWDEVDCFGVPFLYGIILLDKDGTLFCHQSGGLACLQMKEKGIPYVGGNDLDSALQKIEEFIYKEFDGRCVPHGHFFISDGGLAGPITNRDACRIDEILSNAGFNDVCIDRDALDNSCEAWIYALMNGKPCVLVTPNCD